MPWRAAKQLVGGLNQRGAEHNEQPGAMHPAQGAVDSIFHRYIGRQFTTYWTRILGAASETSTSPPPVASGRPEAARRLEDMLSEIAAHPELADTLPYLQHDPARGRVPSLGYVTVDSCPGIGDDTEHTPVPYSAAQPDYIASEPAPLPSDEETLVDVVFVDFILKPVVHLLSMWDPSRTYTVDEAQRWGDVSTQWLYPDYADVAWHPASWDEAWAAMDEAATRDGYPPLAQFDAYEGDPYAPVVAARHAASLVFQGTP